MNIEPGQTKSCLKVLHLEDNPLDAELIRHELEKHNIACSITRIYTQEEFTQALDTGPVDVILSDSSLPTFDTVTALKMTRERWPELPFIFVSGSFSPHLRGRVFREGATDYISKNNLPKLAQVMNWMWPPNRHTPHRQPLPEMGNPVMVQCKGFRCLGYLDESRTWRDYGQAKELPEVLDWWQI